MTPSQTQTPSLEYVFASCEPIGFKVLNYTTIIQNQPTVNNYPIGSVFKDGSGNCWTYVGVFVNGSYIAPINYIVQTYSGDYFATSGVNTYANCESCLVPEIFEVTSVSAGLQPCAGGTIDDHLAWTVNISQPAPQDIDYQITIELTGPNGNSTYIGYGIIPQGQLGDACNNDPCGCGGAYYPGGYQVTSWCLSYINPIVTVPPQFLC
jgi:hypothetical protein